MSSQDIKLSVKPDEITHRMLVEFQDGKRAYVHFVEYQDDEQKDSIVLPWDTAVQFAQEILSQDNAQKVVTLKQNELPMIERSMVQVNTKSKG